MDQEFEDRKKKLKETVGNLDNCCQRVLAYLTHRYPKETGFNKIFRAMQEENRQFSKGTLARHVKHLLAKQLVVVHEEKTSSLKIKPRKYQASPYFIELCRDMLSYKLLDPTDALREMRLDEIKPLTIALIDILLTNVYEFLRNALRYPKLLAAYQRTIIYYHFDNIAEAYTERVLKQDEKEKALATIDEFDKYWKEMRNGKWGGLVRTMHALKSEQKS